MASQEQRWNVLDQHPHRAPLSLDQIRALGNALVALRKALPPEQADKTPIYTAVLRLLKAHVTPLPNEHVSFAQVQGVRLQLFAERLLHEGKEFPKELKEAISKGMVTGFDPTSGLRIPVEQQRLQLHAQQLEERNDIVRERTKLQEMQVDFQRAMAFQPAQGSAEDEPSPEDYIPWVDRRFSVAGVDGYFGQSVPVDRDFLLKERARSLKLRTDTISEELKKALVDHASGKQVLNPRMAALTETRLRHINLLGLQQRMRQRIWNEYQTAERDGRRGSKTRVRTIKQLQREHEKVERSRARQLEAEERDARRKRQAWMNAMTEHLNKFRGYHRDVVRRGFRAVTKAVLKHHEEVARNATRAEREAERARIQKLKEDDEEGYLQLVRQTKNTRLFELLDQTDKYLKELGAVVKEERVRSGVVEYENSASGEDGKRQGYYEIAHAIKEEVDSQSSLLVGGSLKAYQLAGIKWMVSLYNNRLNGILADEMGLGKTIQTLGLIAHLMERKDNPGPYLIIVPLSTISNWELEFAKWAPAIRVVVFKGDAKTRRKLYEEVIEKKSFNVCLVTYEYVVRGKNLLKRVEWQHIIIDEGHRIKNHESRLSAVLHDHYRSRNRLLLTGTPLQNSLNELWSLLNFLLPNVFKSPESFESWFAAPFAQMGAGNLTSTEQQAQLTEEESLLIIRRLHQVLRPFLLRRMKADVLRMGEQLPEKQEHIVLCEMSSWQRNMYVKIVKSERVLFTDRHGRQRFDKLSNPAIQLRKVVNHPYLFFQDHASQIVDTPELWRSSGKFDMLDAIITKLLRTGHRILIFNQMTKVVDLQERLLRYRNIPFYRLDGSTGTDERKRMVNDFNSKGSDVHVFLLTTRAGGLGVNLQTADTVVIFDSDWNPSVDQQAQDRAHRIGQQREVLVLRMLTAKSIEEDVMERASFKRGLEKKIIRAGMFDEQSKDSERQAMLRELLRVEGPVSEGGSEDGLPTEEEMNRILARSEEEFDVFQEVDRERKVEIGSRPRLMIEKEIPEWASKVPKALREKAQRTGAGAWGSAFGTIDLNEPKKRRAAATNVSYGLDQLSERQYLKLMERSEAGEEISMAEAMKSVGRRRKRRRKDAGADSHRKDESKRKEGRRSSQADSETGSDTMGSNLQGNRVSDPTFAIQGYDGDVTESAHESTTRDVGGAKGDEEESGIIRDSDFKDDSEQIQESPKVGNSDDYGSDADVNSDSSDESEVVRRSRSAPIQSKSVSEGRSRKRRNRKRKEGERVGKVQGRRRRRKSGSKVIRDRSVSESSDESSDSRQGDRGGRSTTKRKRVKVRQDSESDEDSKEVNRIGRKRRFESMQLDDMRIPRKKDTKAMARGNERPKMKKGKGKRPDALESGEVDISMDCDDEAEDGEIREDGEVSDVVEDDEVGGDVDMESDSKVDGIRQLSEQASPADSVMGGSMVRGSSQSRTEDVKWSQESGVSGEEDVEEGEVDVDGGSESEEEGEIVED